MPVSLAIPISLARKRQGQPPKLRTAGKDCGGWCMLTPVPHYENGFLAITAFALPAAFASFCVIKALRKMADGYIYGLVPGDFSNKGILPTTLN